MFGVHSVYFWGSRCKSKSRPSVKQLFPILVLAKTKGDWKGYVSLKTMSKLNLSGNPAVIADLSISI